MLLDGDHFHVLSMIAGGIDFRKFRKGNKSANSTEMEDVIGRLFSKSHHFSLCHIGPSGIGH
ncbi:MAG: hypothetical protein CL912_02025 [Deltaproteobacteria bacterium]|nr:hypothetical protein [Deltaproteobacteria bacterium]